MFMNTEMYKHAQVELDKLLESERKGNLDKPIEELEIEVEMFGGMTPQEFMNECILNVIAAVNPEVCTAYTLDYFLNAVYDLVKFRNLTPLTLGDEEWDFILEDGDKGKVYQNKRNFSVFKDDKNGVYHSDGPAMLNIACGKYPDSGEDMKEFVEEDPNE